MSGDTAQLAVSASPLQISSGSEGQVVFFNVNDFDRFVTTQREAFEATVNHIRQTERHKKLIADIAGTADKIMHWCKGHEIASCVIAPRKDDMIIVVTAKNEDVDGALHDEMSALDLETFQENGLRLYWMFLRASEADGLLSFVDQDEMRLLYRANG